MRFIGWILIAAGIVAVLVIIPALVLEWIGRTQVRLIQRRERRAAEASEPDSAVP